MRSPLAVFTAAALVLSAGVATAVNERPRVPVAATATAASAVLPTLAPSPVPTAARTAAPTAVRTAAPTAVRTAVPTTAPTAVPTTVPAAVPTAVPAPPVVVGTAAGRGDLRAYRGLGTWLDAYDWSPEYGGQTGLAAVDAMAQQGVKTLYIQAAMRGKRSDGMLSPHLLGQFLVRAHERGMTVQAWYLPKLDDLAKDRRLLEQIVDLRARDSRGVLHRFDTVGVDIEWRNSVPDVAERNRRLVALSRDLRAKAPDLPLSAIVVAPVVTEDVNRAFWRPFPWQELAPHYDVWQTMGYWTDRKSTSRWRDAHTSTVGNIRYLRRALGQPGAPVHPIGGIGAATEAEAQGFVRAAQEEKALGGSLYDWPTTPSSRYPTLRRVPS